MNTTYLYVTNDRGWARASDVCAKHRPRCLATMLRSLELPLDHKPDFEKASHYECNYCHAEKLARQAVRLNRQRKLKLGKHNV